MHRERDGKDFGRRGRCRLGREAANFSECVSHIIDFSGEGTEGCGLCYGP